MRLLLPSAWWPAIRARTGGRTPPAPSKSFRFTAAVLSLAVVTVMAAAAVAFVLIGDRQAVRIAETLTAGKASAAPPLMRRYGCTGCHTIPGLPGADGQVGPALFDLQARVYIGGHVRNTADNLVRFLVNPRAFSPASAMPATGLSEAEARDVAAWLYAR